MKNSTTINKAQVGTKTSGSTEISKVAVTAFSVTAGLIGIWAVACMVAGVLNSGGPASLVASLFGAMSGTM